MAITHVIRGEDQLPTTPRQIMLWGALERGRGPGPPAAGVRPPAPPGQRAAARSSPSGVTRWRWRCTGSRATCRRPSATTWPCSAGARGTRRSCRSRRSSSSFRLEDVQRSPAFFDVKKLSHINGVYIRALPLERVRARRRGRGSTRCRASGHRAAGATPTRARRPSTRRRGRRSASTPRPSPSSPPWPRSGWPCSARCPSWSTSCSWRTPRIDEDSWQKAIGGDELAPRILADALAAYETCAWDKDSLHEATLAIADSVGRKLGKAQAPIRVAVMGRTRGLPLFDSLAVLGREETCRRLAAALSRLAPAG